MPRPKLFDRTQVLRKAVSLFWQQGFDSTSMQSLVDHLGINRASIYDTFGSKELLFQEAISHYRSDGIAGVKNALDSSATLKEGLWKLFEMSVAPCQSCFIINTATTNVMKDERVSTMVQDHKTAFEHELVEALKQEQAAGRLPIAADLDITAAYIFSLFSGVQVHSKIDTDVEKLRKIYAQGLSAIPLTT